MRRLLSLGFVLGAMAALPWLQACSEEPGEAKLSPQASDSAAAVASAEVNSAGLARADFDVAGMDCGGCVIGTRAALRKLDGVEEADASYEDATGKGAAWTLYDPEKVTPERMMSAIRELGYRPTLVEATS